MNTMRMTASRTENARSRIQESAVYNPEREDCLCDCSSMKGSLTTHYKAIALLSFANRFPGKEPHQHWQRHGAFLERAIVELPQAELRTLRSAVRIPHAQPVPPAHKVGRELARG